MRHNHFNLIRVVAASLVLVSHSYALSTGRSSLEPFRALLGLSLGSMAVDVFFITSGFLVTMSLFKRGDVKTFVLSRALRIYPGLLLALLITVAITGWFFSSLSLQDFWTQPATWLYLAKNALLVGPGGLEMGIAHTLGGAPFTGGSGPVLNGSIWTLPVEIRMYTYLLLVWLLAVRLPLGRWAPRDRERLARWVLSAVALAAVCISLLRAGRPDLDLMQHMFTLFFVGAALQTWGLNWQGRAHWAALALAAVIGAACINRHLFVVIYTLCMPVIVLALAHAGPGWLHGYNRLGDYSYGLYLYAFPVQQWLACAVPGIAPLPMMACALGLSALLAMASWHGVEQHALALKDRLNRP